MVAVGAVRAPASGGQASWAAECWMPCARPPPYPTASARPPRPGREATSPAAEWKPVRQVTNRWVVTVISQRMRRRSQGHSKLISSDHHPPAPATNTQRREPIKREPVRPARTLRLPERPRGTPVERETLTCRFRRRPVHLAARDLVRREAGSSSAELDPGVRRPGHGVSAERGFAS